MASPLTTRRNDYYQREKSSTVYTPRGVARFLFDILSPLMPERSLIFDPAIGSGRLTDPWYDAGHQIHGCDIAEQGARCYEFDQCRFEDYFCSFKPDLVLCNPPFNGAQRKKLYPEVFLHQIFELFGERIPTVLFTPMGFRLNQIRRSERWRRLRDSKSNIDSIVTLPLDIYENVQFHSEILIFNVPDLKPHYFLPEKAL